ncbi:putative nuclease HARBI1 [Spodoptera frugiperda]|uniref:Nuclease HARBI1 n=1 Tax=Spodoptera frugiperda TaxID=7108 RepID=A0A9R0D2A4_SPOFR|nr:putative nuclease HARBI1 [Spodoptera frugiperda]
MAVRGSCITFSLENAKRRDNLEKRRQAYTIRNMGLLATDINYIKIFRLSEELIAQLEEDISPFLTPAKRRGGISNRNKILCTLAFFASGSYQKILGENVRTYISQASASRAIRTVVDAINQPAIIKKYIRFPGNASEREILKQKFYEKFKIPGTIGCIDGTLISMVRPKEHEERFYCRKGYHARNAVIINDPDLNIMHVDVTFGGATHDSFIFNNSYIKTHLEQLNNTGETVYLLGDSGFPLRPYMMIPCSNPEPGSREELYNNLHASARNTAERTIGILKGRFRCLLVHRVLHYDPEMVGKIIKACCVLHNICNRAGVPPVELPSYLQRQEDTFLQLLQQGSQNSISDLDSGRLARSRLINRLWRGQNRQQ